MFDYLRFVVGVLLICLASGPPALWAQAQYGPCVTIQGEQTINTIDYIDGSCIGNVRFIYSQSECANTNEDPCSQINNNLHYIIFPTQTVYHEGFVQDMMDEFACAACYLAVGLMAGESGPGAVVLALAACSGVCTYLHNLDNGYVTCEPDFDSPYYEYSGHKCS